MVGVPHILIVEDQPNTAEMLTSYFQAQGYEVTTVGWGKDALAFIEQAVPDLVMLDIRLPDIDGYEVCRQLRAHRRTEQVPVIFLTERRERKDKLTGLQLGAVDYVTKPFDVQELRLRVRNALRRVNLEHLSNPITGLPAASLADERLRELLASPDWALLAVGVEGLKEFADVYGFVTRDDVLRAIALILSHVAEAAHAPNAFVGHLDDTNFFIVIAPGKVKRAQQMLTERLKEAMVYFYPRADWDAGQSTDDAELPQMNITMGVLTASSRTFSSLADLRQAIAEAQHVI